jgi:hypothetical protein
MVIHNLLCVSGFVENQEVGLNFVKCGELRATDETFTADVDLCDMSFSDERRRS